MPLKDKYPNMYKEPWDGIIDMPPSAWREKGLNSDNYMVKSNHEMFKVLYDNGRMTIERYNNLKTIEYAVMNEDFVDSFIQYFKEAVEKEKK